MAPQRPQKARPGLMADPHFGQLVALEPALSEVPSASRGGPAVSGRGCAINAVPQSLQNLLPSAISAPHLGHCIVASTLMESSACAAPTHELFLYSLCHSSELAYRYQASSRN